MKELSVETSPAVPEVFANYPDRVRKKMWFLRELILETARELDGLTAIEETLKWGEPSYVTKHGSTLRMDWKKKSPEHYALYFKCTSKLVETFRSVYENMFSFEGNRAIVFHLDEQIPRNELKTCIACALRYHKVKHLPKLGIDT
jgi:hypothetical protein